MEDLANSLIFFLLIWLGLFSCYWSNFFWSISQILAYSQFSATLTVDLQNVRNASRQVLQKVTTGSQWGRPDPDRNTKWLLFLLAVIRAAALHTPMFGNRLFLFQCESIPYDDPNYYLSSCQHKLLKCQRTQKITKQNLRIYIYCRAASYMLSHNEHNLSKPLTKLPPSVCNP